MTFEDEIESLVQGIIERTPGKTDRELAEHAERMDAQPEDERSENWRRVRKAIQDEIDKRPGFPYDV